MAKIMMAKLASNTQSPTFFPNISLAQSFFPCTNPVLILFPLNILVFCFLFVHGYSLVLNYKNLSFYPSSVLLRKSSQGASGDTNSGPNVWQRGAPNTPLLRYASHLPIYASPITFSCTSPLRSYALLISSLYSSPLLNHGSRIK